MSGALIGLVPRWGTPPNLRGGIRIEGGEGGRVLLNDNKEMMTMTKDIEMLLTFLRDVLLSAMRKEYQS